MNFVSAHNAHLSLSAPVSLFSAVEMNRKGKGGEGACENDQPWFQDSRHYVYSTQAAAAVSMGTAVRRGSVGRRSALL